MDLDGEIPFRSWLTFWSESGHMVKYIEYTVVMLGLSDIPENTTKGNDIKRSGSTKSNPIREHHD